jgi:hypothetical protein
VVFSIRASSLTLALVTVMALAAQTRVLLPVVATVFIAQVLIAVGPSPADERGRAIPTPQLNATLLGGAISSAIAYHPGLLVGAQTRASLDSLKPGVFAGVMLGIAAGLTAAIVAQAARKDGRGHLVESLAAVTSLVVFAACASAWVGAARANTGREVVTVGCAAVLATFVVILAPGDRRVVLPIALMVGAAAGAAASRLVGGEATLPFAAVVGLGAGGFALVGLAVGTAWTHGRSHLPSAWGLPGALAFVMAGPLVFVAGDFLAATV